MRGKIDTKYGWLSVVKTRPVSYGWSNRYQTALDLVVKPLKTNLTLMVSRIAFWLTMFTRLLVFREAEVYLKTLPKEMSREEIAEAARKLHDILFPDVKLFSPPPVVGDLREKIARLIHAEFHEGTTEWEDTGKIIQGFYFKTADSILALLQQVIERDKPKDRPRIVCLCGSTRFSEAFQKAQLDFTLAGKIVLTIGCNMRSDTEIFGSMSELEKTAIKTKLDELHKRKIDMADEVHILNVGNYMGESTISELSYAYKLGKLVTFLQPSDALLFNWNTKENYRKLKQVGGKSDEN